MTFLAILVWLLIVASTAYMLKSLIFNKDQALAGGCSSTAGGGAARPENVAAKDFSSDVIQKQETKTEDQSEPESGEK